MAYELLLKREIISVCKCGQLTKKHMPKAISTSDKLNTLLNDAGLKVSSFEIFNEERPGNKMQKIVNLFWVKRFFLELQWM